MILFRGSPRMSTLRACFLGFCAAMVSMLGACSKSVEVNTSPSDEVGAAGDGGVSIDPADIPNSTLAVSGQVSDTDTGQPIGGALVATEPPIGQIRTNAQGMYVFAANDFPLLEGQLQTLFRITASREGYLQDHAQVLLQNGHNRNVDIVLGRASAIYRVELSTDLVEFDDADFTGDSATQQVSFWLDTTSDETASFRINIPTSDRAWLTVTPDSGTVGAGPEFIDVTVDRSALTEPTTQTDVTFVVGSSQKPLTVRVLQ